MCWISIRPTTNMTNHNNTATLCEIRNSVKILLDLVRHRVSTVYGFWWNIVCSNCSGLCCGWMWKIWQYNCVHNIKHISMFYLEVSIDIIYENGSFLFVCLFCFRYSKYVVGLLWHNLIWNFLMKNKEKNQAHGELVYNHKVQVNYYQTSNIYWQNTFPQGLIASKRKWPCLLLPWLCWVIANCIKMP